MSSGPDSARHWNTAARAARDRLRGPGFFLGGPGIEATAGLERSDFATLSHDRASATAIEAHLHAPALGAGWRAHIRHLAGALRPEGLLFLTVTDPDFSLGPDFESTLRHAALEVVESGALAGPFSELADRLDTISAVAATPDAPDAPLEGPPRWMLALGRRLARYAMRADPWILERSSSANPPATSRAMHRYALARRVSVPARRLHVGAGRERLDGWVNLDLQSLPSVDVVCDASLHLGALSGSVEVVFAEHFLEHLRIENALAFLREAHRVLEPGGALRLTTPNLRWVIATHDGSGPDASPQSDWIATLAWNRAFHGWEHQFLWSRPMLAEALAASGFEDLRWPAWGESEDERLRGLERHDRYPDEPKLPHVLVVEGRKGTPDPERLRAFNDLIWREFAIHARG